MVDVWRTPVQFEYILQLAIDPSDGPSALMETQQSRFQYMGLIKKY